VSTDEYTAYVTEAWPRLFRTAYALTGHPSLADDLLQATLVKLFVSWRRVRQADSVDAYTRTVMVNLARSTWRSRARRSELLTDEHLTAPVAHGFESDLVESDRLWREIQDLPPRQRAVVVLRYYEDLSEREIASVLGVAPGTVKSLASAALRKLRVNAAENAPLGDPR
jgi:RNA polymerase sigma-70 factor (sigma-E family)